MLVPSSANSRILAIWGGSSALTLRSRRSLPSVSFGSHDTATLRPASRFVRLPMWSSTWPAIRRASMLARSSAAFWSVRQRFQSPTLMSAMKGTTLARTRPISRDRMLRSSIICPLPLFSENYWPEISGPFRRLRLDPDSLLRFNPGLRNRAHARRFYEPSHGEPVLDRVGQPVLIVGGGIGGLTAALALAQKGV